MTVAVYAIASDMVYQQQVNYSSWGDQLGNESQLLYICNRVAHNDLLNATKENGNLTVSTSETAVRPEAERVSGVGIQEIKWTPHRNRTERIVCIIKLTISYLKGRILSNSYSERKCLVSSRGPWKNGG